MMYKPFPFLERISVSAPLVLCFWSRLIGGGIVHFQLFFLHFHLPHMDIQLFHKVHSFRLMLYLLSYIETNADVLFRLSIFK